MCGIKRSFNLILSCVSTSNLQELCYFLLLTRITLQFHCFHTLWLRLHQLCTTTSRSTTLTLSRLPNDQSFQAFNLHQDSWEINADYVKMLHLTEPLKQPYDVTERSICFVGQVLICGTWYMNMQTWLHYLAYNHTMGTKPYTGYLYILEILVIQTD